MSGGQGRARALFQTGQGVWPSAGNRAANHRLVTPHPEPVRAPFVARPYGGKGTGRRTRR